jgi:nitroreductase
MHRGGSLPPSDCKEEVQMTEAIEFIKKRRSIRKFTPQTVEKEKVLLLLQAAMAAPSASDSKPWEFVVVTETATLDKLRAFHPYGNYNGTLAVIVCGHPAISGKPSSSELFWTQDCSAATENLLIEAAGLGLGAVWCGVWPREERVRALTDIVGLPEGCLPLNMIWVGYPGEEKASRTQYNPDRVHWEKY